MNTNDMTQPRQDPAQRASHAGRRVVLQWLFLAALATGCHPGVGAQMPSGDFVHTFVQRDLDAVRSASTPSFRHAVWDRISPAEFPGIAALMGHRSGARLVDTRFADERAVIQMRTAQRQQYELRLLYQEPDWRVDDVGLEVEPAVYVSQRRQAEAVLAVRDFCQALSPGDAKAVGRASSAGFAAEVWERADPATMASWSSQLQSTREACSEPLRPVFVASEGSVAAQAGSASTAPIFYFTSENGMLVVDDVRPAEGAPTLRVRLRKGR